MNATCKYECTSCQKSHDTASEAVNCCQPYNEVWYCRCGEKHYSERDAEECCRGKS